MIARSKWLVPHGALLVALFAAVSCSTNHETPPLAEPAGGTAGSAGDTDAGGSAGDATACAAVPAPSTWAAWVMPNPAESGLPNLASYALSESGNIVTDEVTGLVWQRNVDARLFTWDDAKQYCACLTLDGVGGWQLPSRIELASLVDWSAASPSIDPNAFPSTSNENFWTLSPVVTDPGLAYLVFFLNGHTTYSDVTYEYRVRCVQAPATTSGEHYVISSGAVYDTRTKLTWQQTIPPARYPWTEAETYCSELVLDGGGWRLPSINELQTLVDDTVNPSIDQAAFPGTPSEYFWSSSAVIDDPARAWTGFFTNGSTYSFAITAAKNVRCVR